MALTTIRPLYDLQELDWERDRCQAELISVEARLHDDSALITARAESVEREENIRQLTRRHERQSKDVQELREKVQALENRLYGGSVRNPKELESLQSEVQYAQGQAEEGEEELINLMIGLDENEKLEAKAKSDLAQMERAWAETQATLTKEQAALKERLQGLAAKRLQLTSGIAPSLLKQYDRLWQSRQGYSVAKVERGMCMGCRLTLPTKELQRVRTFGEPVTCSSCGRILYVS